MKRRLLIFGLISLVVMASFATFARPIRAASAGCAAVAALSGGFDISSTRTTGAQTFSAGEVVSVAVTTPGVTFGSTTVQLTVSGGAGFNQTSASPLSFTIPSDGTYTVTVTNQSPEQLDQITASCSGSAPSRWSGYSDGRLNPFEAEDYSLWCANNNLLVYRYINGSGQLLASVPIPTLIGLRIAGVVGAATSAGPLTITRESADNYVVSGNNGNNAPRFGIKPFTLTECIRRNGVVPTPSRTSTRRPTRTPIPTKTPTPAPTLADLNYLNGVGTVVTLLLDLKPTDPTKDKDGDGIADRLDVCPNEPGPGLPFGCPDTDGDGLGLLLDKCPSEVGLPADDGCPDGDGDGVPAYQDLCPNYKPPVGNPSAFGCADPDGDGFPSGFFPNGQPMDFCPLQDYTPGVQYIMGCPDPDSDGLIASGAQLSSSLKDNCPLDAGPISNQGCPTGGTLSTPVVISAGESLFDFANQVGAFGNITITTGNDVFACTLVNLGFCVK